MIAETVSYQLKRVISHGCSHSQLQRLTSLTMDGSVSGGAAKRHRSPPVEEVETALMPQLTTPATTPLMLLSFIKSFFDTLVFLRLCNPQGHPFFSFILIPPRVLRPFAGTQFTCMLFNHAERMHVLGCGFKGKLVRLMSLGMGNRFEPSTNWGACHKFMLFTVRRVVSKLMDAHRAELAKTAEVLCASGQCASAQMTVQQAIALGDLPTRALYAWLLLEGREGVVQDHAAALQLALEGTRLGCHHCQGVLSLRYHCYWSAGDCEDNGDVALELARESTRKGSKYGQFSLGQMYSSGHPLLTQTDEEEASCASRAAALFRLAIDQGFDGAQNFAGALYFGGRRGYPQDIPQALHLFRLAAAQGSLDGQLYASACARFSR